MCQTLIKPVEIEAFLVPFPKMTPKFRNKPAATQRFRNAFRDVGKPYKTNERRGFSKAKNALRKPL